jgi:hypothetical protein
MNSETLDEMLNRLEAIMPSKPPILDIGLHRQDWTPVWNLAKQIQEAFNAGVRYPTKQLRQAAWNRFNTLRSEASARADAERDHLRTRSNYHKSIIFKECAGIGYSRVSDTIFFFDQTTMGEMKARGRYLAGVMKYLSEHKHEMLGEDKKECYNRIHEIKEQHEQFWSEYRLARDARKDERLQKIEANLSKNRDMYRRTADALQRFRERSSELRAKISTSTSDKWRAIFSGWLSETESKIDDIESQLRRIEGWIEENEEHLRKL